MRELICTMVLLFAVGGVWAARAHQHGAATLTVAIDDGTLALEFESPLENLVGFEHAPRDEAERQALQALRQRFADPATLFVPAPAAKCRAAPARLELPQGSGAHADLHAAVRFECAAPAALRSLEVRLFDAFPRLQRVKTQIAVPGRQSWVELHRRQPRADW